MGRGQGSRFRGLGFWFRVGSGWRLRGLWSDLYLGSNLTYNPSHDLFLPQLDVVATHQRALSITLLGFIDYQDSEVCSSGTGVVRPDRP